MATEAPPACRTATGGNCTWRRYLVHFRYDMRYKAVFMVTALFLVWVALQHGPRPRVLHYMWSYGDLVVLPEDEAVSQGAVCLDGSPPGYYLRRGTGKGAKNWIIYLEGGGWCWDVPDCYKRSLTNWGSSKYFKWNFWFDGFLSNSPSVNPDFYNWNVAMLKYCDGASFAGNRTDVVVHEGKQLYFRGRRVLQALLDHLLAHGLDQADRVILSGVSAGGVAVMLHADYVRSRLPARVTYHALPDAGFFPDTRNITGHEHIRTLYQRSFTMQNCSGGVDDDCIKDKTEEMQWQCYIAQYAYKYVQTPMFIANSGYDYWSLWFVYHLRCHPEQCPPEKQDKLEEFHQKILAITSQVRKSEKDGIFLPSCFIHSLTSFGYTWTDYLVSGTSLRDAFHKWYTGKTPAVVANYFDKPYPENPTCPWTIEFYNRVTQRLGAYEFYVQ
ncbi:pectin acetylesterase 8-like isoform X2 [Branchiostoma floridae]|nr:pectin acetylesterase 8-like isoform X2 [Branchiostoma floridae]XP_035689065.1 pectin acetylesterase 8-like isoform X2 [Branchiostoma floridae]